MCDITVNNFDELIDEILEDIRSATALSIDCEFSGICVKDKESPSLFDFTQDRYNKLSEVVKEFELVQVGVCCLEESSPGNFDVICYNFYTFPLTFNRLRRQFKIDSEAIEFLTRNGFDIKKWVQGISIMNDQEEELYWESFTKFSSSVNDIFSTITEWLAGADYGDTLTIAERHDAFGDLLHGEIRDRFKNVWTYKSAQGYVKVVKREENEILKLKDKDKRYVKETATKILGFTKIFREIVASKKPIIGHNCLTDFMFLFEKCYKALPKDLKLFKGELHELFPVIFDTKQIAYRNSAILKSYEIETSGGLVELHQSLIRAGKQLLNKPLLTHLRSNKYENDMFHHEAGWDAFISMEVYIRLSHTIMQHKNVLSKVGPIRFVELKSAVENCENRINLIQAKSDHLNILGNDPESRRPPLLYVRLLKDSSFEGLMNSISSYGYANLRQIDSMSGVIATDSHRAARKIFEAYRSSKDYELSIYNYFIHNRHTKVILYICTFFAGVTSIYLFKSFVR